MEKMPLGRETLHQINTTPAKEALFAGVPQGRNVILKTDKSKISYIVLRIVRFWQNGRECLKIRRQMQRKRHKMVLVSKVSILSHKLQHNAPQSDNNDMTPVNPQLNWDDLALSKWNICLQIEFLCFFPLLYFLKDMLCYFHCWRDNIQVNAEGSQIFQ